MTGKEFKNFYSNETKYFSDCNGRTSGTSKNHTTFANKGCTNFFQNRTLTKTMASSNHQQRTGQYISLCSLELHNFKYWLNRQNPENIKASLMSVIDHDTNEVHCHVNINWSPNTPDQDTFPIHFRDMRKSTVLLPGDLRNLDSTLVQQWQERVLKHIIERRMIHQNERPTRTHDERQAILNKTTQIMADLRVNQPEHARWIKWYSIDTAPPTPKTYPMDTH